MNKLLLYAALLVLVPPVGLFQVVTDNQIPVAAKIIACSIGLVLGVVLYASLYLVGRGFFAA
ncbi:hypothetical protein [Candidatus Cyanaurora vandensis]|uniref:hypothetical protein n=1 Tax=Candidatus Cyanaurora vandensis TaxID=2714958 RepID=UPI00257DAD26|nr:hypothetical protein [Candidatus Cyanaurora vandensis]